MWAQYKNIGYQGHARFLQIYDYAPDFLRRTLLNAGPAVFWPQKTVYNPATLTMINPKMPLILALNIVHS